MPLLLPQVAPLPRRFGDSLPPPTTVYRHRQPSPVTQAAAAQQSKLREQSVFNSYAAAAAAVAAPAPPPDAPVSLPQLVPQQEPQPEAKHEPGPVEEAPGPVSAAAPQPASRAESAPVCGTRRSERICAQQSKLASCNDEVRGRAGVSGGGERWGCWGLVVDRTCRTGVLQGAWAAPCHHT